MPELKKAIVLGGTHDHIRVFEILKKKGYFTILIDYLENPPARRFADEFLRESTLDKERVLDIAKRIGPELIVAACIDQALLTMAYVCEDLKVPCHISYKTALELTNKTFMKRKFVEAGILTSKFVIQDKHIDIKTIDLNYPLVVKPVDSNSSKGITKIENSSRLPKAIEYAFSFSRSQEVIVEEFIQGEEYSVDVAVKNSVPTIVLVSKNIKLPLNEENFTIIQSLYPATDDPLILNQIIDIANKIVGAYHIKNGPLLIQLINQDSKLFVVEFSARLGGGSKHHFIKKITGFDMLEWFINIFNADIGGIKLKKNFNCAILNYMYAHKGRIDEFVNFDQLMDQNIIADYFYYKSEGTKITNHISSADRPAGYLVVDNDYQALEEKLSFAAKHLKILDKNGFNLVLKTF